MKKEIIVMMLGARMHYAIPLILRSNERLGCFFTDYYRKKTPVTWSEWCIEKIISMSKGKIEIVNRMSLRRSDQLPDEKIISYPLYSILYVVGLKLLKTHYYSRVAFCLFGSLFARLVAKKIASKAVILYGYDCASLEAFQVNKRNGGINIYEQTILPYQLEHSLMRNEFTKYRKYTKEKIGRYHEGSSARLWNEWGLADIIIVGSEFVKEGMIRLGVSASKIKVVPYGVKSTKVEGFAERVYQSKKSHVLNILFVGEVGLRKGAISLIEALRSIESKYNFKVDFVGRVAICDKYIKSLSSRFEFHGKVNRETVKIFYSNADIFVLPSVVEGSATVTYEALSVGLPVMATLNSGSVVQDGVDGIVIKESSVQEIRNAIVKVLENRKLLDQFRENIRLSRYKVSFERYERDIANIIDEIQYVSP
ncbi:MAG: hypothetical protein C0422_13620 [Alcaligenaceae bacterium]|nr:hypothetical protein [Alcaligenaceae bacterium]